MKTELITREEIKIVGLKIRTNNAVEFSPETSKISQLVGLYWQNNMVDKIQHRISPLKTYSIYTEYDSDEYDDYSYFIGEAVSDFSDQDVETFDCLTIPAQKYQRFTTAKGEIPKIIIDAWQEIWKMDALKDQRNYVADFELFDERCKDPTNAELDIYVGVDLSVTHPS